ncbi:Ig-like domain-containing protein (plasmid) [Enterobacter sp. RHB15-C17]|nr:Ig-like domain-containing protein [Enterobacter sp. RHB15-C17]
MSDNISAGNSLIFYTGKNYAGTAQSVSHGVTGVLAASTTSWSEQSVAMSGMQAFVSSTVNAGDASMVYLGHQEDLVTVSQTDLTLLYPSSDQFPLNYLGLDPAQAVMVWLDVDAAQAAPNAVASTALVGASPTTLTTLSLPGRPGLLGCVAKIGGSSVIANCAYGDYNTADGTVAWSGAGMLILEYTGGGISLIDGGGFPDGWTFSDPQLQGDGSWVVTLNGGVPASDTISTVTANPGSITDDGVSASVITAKVVDGTGQPASGVTVTWSTTLGNLSATSSVTGADGTATTTLTDSGTPGTATVTAAITGSSKTVGVTVTDSAAGYVLTGLTSDKGSIVNNGTDAATLTATVHDGSGNSVAGVTVYWSTTAGNLSAASSVTGSSGQATIKLTDSGTPGTATVTASLANGSRLTRTVTVEDKSTGYVVSALTSDKTSIINDGSDAATLTATVHDGSGKGVSGVTVNWSTTLGNLSAASSVTGSSGQATIKLTDSGTPGTATVTASLANGSQKTCAVTVEDKSASDVVSSLTSDKDSIVNNGTDAATLTATVHDGSGNSVAGVTVYWSTTAGNLSAASSVTGSSGQATIKLTDSGTPGTATVTASLANGSTLTRVITVEDKSATYVVSSLTSDKGSIVNDGTDAATLTATVHDGSGNGVSGVTVNWSTTTGNLSAASSVTDSSGQATTRLTDTGDTGTATVTASLANGSTLTRAVTVEDKSASDVVISLTSDKDSIVNNGTDAATLTATVHDGSGKGVSGVTVNWSTTLGNLSAASSVTGSSGQATIKLTDSGTPGTATVTASLANGSTLTRAVTVEDKSASDVVISLTSDKSSIVNNGTDAATLKATVHDGIGSGNPVAGVTVNWSTTLGSVGPQSSVTAANGTATTRLTDSGDSGTATVAASLANGSTLTRTVTVEDKSAGYVVSTLTSDKTSIINDGSDAATLTATVHDGSGNGVYGVTVTWSTTLGNLSAASSVTGSSGQATTRLTADQSGTASITARLDNDSHQEIAVEIMTAYVEGGEDFNECRYTELELGIPLRFMSGLEITLLSGEARIRPDGAFPELKMSFVTYNTTSLFTIPGPAQSLHFTWGSFASKLPVLTFYDENDNETGCIIGVKLDDESYSSHTYTMPAGGHYTYFTLYLPTDENSMILDNLVWY